MLPLAAVEGLSSRSQGAFVVTPGPRHPISKNGAHSSRNDPTRNCRGDFDRRRINLPVSFSSSTILSATSTSLLMSESCCSDIDCDNNNRDDTVVIENLPTFSEGSGSRADAVDVALPSTTKVPKEWRDEVLDQLRNVIDPDLNNDIVTLGFVKNLEVSSTDNDGQENVRISFDVELTTPACPIKEEFAADCTFLVKSLVWTDTVDVTMTAAEPTPTAPVDEQDYTLGMSQVGAVIAVSSCKGGVGKSTTAVNLAFSLQKLGATVGILDTDVYGPSLPTMVEPEDDLVRFVGRQISPLERNGVKLMSFGYINEGSAVMRGPMVTQLLDQFMTVVNWGPVDYLILDMPPGTGDIPLTLTQRLDITAAVIVTTPQELSFADVVRGIEMFDSVQVPAVAVVENMAYYEVPGAVSSAEDQSQQLDRSALKQAIANRLALQPGLDAKEQLNGDEEKSEVVDGLAEELVDIVMQQQKTSLSKEKPKAPEKVEIFGPGHRHRLSDQFGIEHSFSVPLMNKIAENGDSGTPYVLEHPDSQQAAIYNDLAKAVVSEVAKAKHSGNSKRPTIVYNQDQHVLQVDFPQPQQQQQQQQNDDDGDNVLSAALTPATLRRACRCAACVEELTGRQILVPETILESTRPIAMGPTGNYAWSIDWSDGHRSLYPYRQIKSLMQAKPVDAEMRKDPIQI